MLATVAFAASLTAAFVPTMQPRAAVLPRAAVQMDFFSDLEEAKDKFMSMIMPPNAPTLAEAEMYCMDEESSGCTVEMMELLENKKAEVKPPKEVRWSAEID